MTATMRHAISILMLCATGHLLDSREMNECTTYQKMLQCETSKGFTYRVPQGMTVYLRDRHCEHGWYHTNGTLIADSTIAAHENLTLSTCASLQWQLHCDNIPDCWIINYTVQHQATLKSLPGNYTFTKDKENTNSPIIWPIAIIVGSVMSVIILPVIIWLFWKTFLKPNYTPPGEGGSETDDCQL